MKETPSTSHIPGGAHARHGRRNWLGAYILCDRCGQEELPGSALYVNGVWICTDCATQDEQERCGDDAY